MVSFAVSGEFSLSADFGGKREGLGDFSPLEIRNNASTSCNPLFQSNHGKQPTGNCFETYTIANKKMVSNIWIAAANDEKDAVAKLVEVEGLSPNAKDPNGYTPMHAAASYGHLDLLKYLLSKGGDINIQDAEGDTPLHHVEDLSVAKALIEQFDADYKIKNSDGLTAAEYIEEEDEFPDVAKYLRGLAHGKPADAGENGGGDEDAEKEAKEANAFLESLPEPRNVDGHEIKYTLETEQQQDGDEQLSPEELEERRKKIEAVLNSENPEEELRKLIQNAVHEGLKQDNDESTSEEPSSKKRK
ncbi:uncharacterized protein LODBEIA_P36690 [Lodderomyces beijingensis]|uniref:Ankyrin repeat-containing protein n=1 Tax=Lodderomyces beijingensis TaxID=1775926 RepID=A0ABP0ZMR4_9ASCO